MPNRKVLPNLNLGSPKSLPSPAIVAVQEVVDVALDIRLRIPKEFSQHIRPKGRHPAVTVRRIVALLKQAFDTVPHEKLNIGLQHLKVGKGLKVIGKVGCVIPDIKQQRNRLPRFDVLAEEPICFRWASLKGVSKTV